MQSQSTIMNSPLYVRTQVNGPIPSDHFVQVMVQGIYLGCKHQLAAERSMHWGIGDHRDPCIWPEPVSNACSSAVDLIVQKAHGKGKSTTHFTKAK